MKKADSGQVQAGGFLLSPYGLTCISSAVFLAAWLTPPTFYSTVIGERDLVFLDPRSILFFALCATAFVAGCGLVDVFLPTGQPAADPVSCRRSPVIFLLIPMTVCMLLTWRSVDLLLANNPALIDLIVGQQGYRVKEELDIHQPLGLASIWLLGICWWAAWRHDQIVFDKPWKRRFVTLSIWLGLFLVLASASLKLGRGEFMPVAAGTALLYLLRRRARRTLSRKFMVRFALFVTVLVSVAFLSFSLARGSEDLLADAVAYTTASYNRMAAMLAGRLSYPHAGTGVYLSSFLSFNTGFNRVFPLNAFMGWPTFDEVWAAEFASTWHAGLNGFLIWCGTFGYIYSDFGWFAPLVVLFQGILCGLLWRAVRLGRVIGFVLYPWFAFCILFWFGTNFFFDTKMVVLMLVALAMMLYERISDITAAPADSRVQKLI